MIVHPDKFEIRAGLPDGFVAVVTAVPSGLPDNSIWRQDLDDRSVSVPSSYGTVSFAVYTSDGKDLVGLGVFAADHTGVQCDSIDVQIPYRRRGVASWMYLRASEVFGAPVHPSPIRSDDALLFWGDREAISFDGS